MAELSTIKTWENTNNEDVKETIKEPNEYIKEHGIAGMREILKQKLEWENVKTKISIIGDYTDATGFIETLTRDDRFIGNSYGYGDPDRTPGHPGQGGMYVELFPRYKSHIRSLKDDDEGAAKTGVTETTMECPTNFKIMICDLPGIGRIWMVASASAAAALVPLPGLNVAVDLALLTNEVSLYKSQLGLPDENSYEFRKMSPENQEKVRKFCVTSAVQMAAFLATYTAGTTVEEFARFIPLVGLAIAGGISFSSTYYFLHQCLNELEGTALEFLDEMTSRTVDDFDID